MTLRRLAEFLAGLSYQRLPAPVARKATLVALDTIGVIVGGSAAPELRAWAARLDSAGAATLLGGGRRVHPREAGLWNGTAGSVLELYEGSRFTRGPTAIQFLPAALAEAERTGAGGQRVLTALVAGYEVASRLARAGRLKELHHPSGTWGVMGAAAAVGWLRGFDPQQLAGAIDVAACLLLTTSLRTVREGATIRNCYAGVANAHGLLAADLVEAGFTGLANGAERVYGELLCDGFEPTAVERGLGEGYEIERGYFKRHACYRHSHSALDALGLILEKERRAPEDARVLRVYTYDFAARLTNPEPETTLAAQFSIPHALAARWVLDEAGPEAFTREALVHPRIARLRRLVTVLERPEYTAMQPDRRPATVEVELADGRTLSQTVELARGEPENPFTAAELEAKFLGLTGDRLGGAAARRLCAGLQQLDEVPDVRPLLAGALGA